MARAMGDNGEAFRASITSTTTHDDGTVKTHTFYEGPYANAGAAKSRITWAKRVGERTNRQQQHYREGTRYQVTVEGKVERASTNWEPVT